MVSKVVVPTFTKRFLFLDITLEEFNTIRFVTF